VITSLLLQLKVFLFIMAILTLIVDMFHVISVFRLKSGKLATQNELIVFGVALSYVLTMLICGF
jgi:ABC-type Fe3+-siderophore transport system permease subunit